MRHYNWLIFLVNLQRIKTVQEVAEDYNWLIFLVNLQQTPTLAQDELY